MSGERDPLRLQLAIWAAWLAFFAMFAHGYLENSDSVVTMHGARAWLARGEPGLLLENDDPLLLSRERELLRAGGQVVRGRNGEHYVQFAIGHQALMVPCVALGRLAERWWPGPARRQRELHGGDVIWGGHFWERFFCSLLPLPFAAGAGLLVWRIARALGAGRSDAWRVMLVTVLCTQVWPGASETMSDVPGLCLLLGAVDAVVRYARCGAGAWGLFWAGVLGGLTVLVRYPQALPVGVLLGFAGGLAIARRRVRDVAALAAGTAPFLALLLLANWLRFGNPLDTGYRPGPDWWSMPWQWGIPLVLLSPCKGALVFSPPLWPACVQRLPRPRGLVIALLLAALAPVLLIARTQGWSGSQCWGIRYVTPSVVIVLVTLLALGRPWARRPRLFWACALLGAAFQLGGVLAPYRGHQLLAHSAASVEWAREIASGATSLDALPNQYMTDPRFTPLWGHYAYALAAAQGRLEGPALPAASRAMFFGLETAPGGPEPMFEDRGFRHVGTVYLAELAGWPAWSLALATAVAAAGAWLALRRALMRAETDYASVVNS